MPAFVAALSGRIRSDANKERRTSSAEAARVSDAPTRISPKLGAAETGPQSRLRALLALQRFPFKQHVTHQSKNAIQRQKSRRPFASSLASAHLVDSAPTVACDLSGRIQKLRARLKRPSTLSHPAPEKNNQTKLSAYSGSSSSAKSSRPLTFFSFTVRIATIMLMIIGIETKRIPNPRIVSAPPRNSVYAERAALNAGWGIPHCANLIVNASRLCI